jgi:hypothetical protein
VIGGAESQAKQPGGQIQTNSLISERLKTTQKRFQQKRQQRRKSSFGLVKSSALFRIAGLGTWLHTSARETNSCFQTKDDIFVKLLSQLRIGRLMRKSNRLLLSRVGVDPGDMVCPKVVSFTVQMLTESTNSCIQAALRR